MKAMILAAGRGERMRPLTDHTPKPLLLAGGKPLIKHTIEKLAKAGFTQLVINIAHLGHLIKQTLGDGHQFGVDIIYSDEKNQALETAGGIIKALPLLGEQPFLVINGDIANDFDLSSLRKKTIDLAHLVLVPNPDHHSEGDFHLKNNGQLCLQNQPKLTYSGIGIFNPALFDAQPAIKSKLAPLLKNAITQEHVSGELFNGFWLDIGTPERLEQFNQRLSN